MAVDDIGLQSSCYIYCYYNYTAKNANDKIIYLL